jgi:hypothetical protein
MSTREPLLLLLRLLSLSPYSSFSMHHEPDPSHLLSSPPRVPPDLHLPTPSLLRPPASSLHQRGRFSIQPHTRSTETPLEHSWTLVHCFLLLATSPLITATVTTRRYVCSKPLHCGLSCFRWCCFVDLSNRHFLPLRHAWCLSCLSLTSYDYQHKLYFDLLGAFKLLVSVTSCLKV